MRAALLVTLVCAACGRIGFDRGEGRGDGGSDAKADANGIDANLVATGEVPITAADLIDSRDPVIAWSGTEAGLAWSDLRDGNREIYFARMDAMGQRIGNDVRVTNRPGNATTPAIAWNGSEYGIAYADTSDGDPEIYFARLDEQGNRIGNEIRITTAVGAVYGPVLTWNGSVYLLLWDDARPGTTSYRVYALILDSAGAVVSSELPITNALSSPHGMSVTATPTGFAVVYDNRPAAALETWLTFVDVNGQEVGPEVGVPVPMPATYAPSVAVSGNNLVVAYHSDRASALNVFARTLDMSGVPIGAEVTVTTVNNAYQPQLATVGGNVFAVWYDFRNGNYEVYGARLDSAGQVAVNDIRLSNAAGESRYVKIVAASPTHAIITWADGRNGGSSVYEVYARIIAL